MKPPRIERPITAAQVRKDFNDLRAVVHYAKAAHEIGLWASERLLIERHFTDKAAPLLEAGCGAGRVCVALHALGYGNLTAFDFARELVDQAEALAAERGAAIAIHHADATRLDTHPAFAGPPRFEGCLFLFNGLMQIPLRRNRLRALRQLAAVCRPGASFLFSTHDRDHSPPPPRSTDLPSSPTTATSSLSASKPLNCHLRPISASKTLNCHWRPICQQAQLF